MVPGLQSEVASLAAAKASTSAVFTPYIIPDAHALCTGLHLVKKMIKSEKFLFVIPMAGNVYHCVYVKVKIICRYIFLRFWLRMRFASTKLYAEMVQGQHIILMHVGIIAHVSGYKILCFGANPPKYQTLIPAKNSHHKVCVCVVKALLLQ